MTGPADARSRHFTLSRGTTTLFLSLSLLLLAFFIVLVSLSRYDRHRVDPVLSGVARAFSDYRDHAGLFENPLFTGQHGRWPASGRSFEGDLTDILTGDLRVLRVFHHPGAGFLQAVLPVDALFEPGRASLLPGRLKFLDRLVAVLSSPPHGWRCEMSFLVQVSSSDTMNQKIDLTGQRAVAFARVMTERGVPPDMLAVGEEPGESGQLVLSFRLVPGGE